MADVTVTVDADERGQLVLVFAMTLAIVFVVLALFLNTAIYTENIATRQSDIAGASDAAAYRDSAVDVTTERLQHANYNNNSSHSALHESLTGDVETWSDMSATMRLTRGRSANVSIGDVNNGTRITQVQNDSFANRTGQSDWTLVDGTNHVRDFSMTVQRDSLTDTNLTESDFGDAFQVTFEGDSGQELAIRVFRNDSGGAFPADTINVVLVDVDTGFVSPPCFVEAEQATIDVSNGSIGGKPCSDINEDSEWDELSRPLKISFNNTMSGGSENVNGTFNMTVSKNTVLDPDNDYDGSVDGIFRTDAIYAADLHVDYRTSRVQFDTIIRLAPGELR